MLSATGKAAVLAVIVTLPAAGAVQAQATMTVREFNQIAAAAPRNATALLRPSVRRAWDVMNGSIGAAREEEARARAAGRTPPFCIPGRTNIKPDDFNNRMRAAPAAQQGQTVHQVVRVWMVERFPGR
jgi:hypothetical protein